jgi:hypothetical protein
MKPGMPHAILLAAIVGLALTFHCEPQEQQERSSVVWHVSEPSAVDLRICARELIVRAFIEDRLSLPEAAALFREVDRLLPPPPVSRLATDDDRLGPMPASDDEYFCRIVTCWIRDRVESPEIITRLDEEFHACLDAGDGRLPEPKDLMARPTDLLGLAWTEWLTESYGIAVRARPTAGGFVRGK